MEEIRDNLWVIMSSKQQQKREFLINKYRNIEQVKNKHVDKEDIIKIANQLKKKTVGSEELLKLKEIFLENKDSSSTFLKVNGALEALVRALSGQDAKFQLSAAYCLCNLSLGEKYLRILKAAGPYLLLHLEGMNSSLREVCVWTLGNLASHDAECVRLMKKQGAIPLISSLLTSEDENIIIGASYALSHLSYAGFDVLTPDDLEQIVDPAVSLFKRKHSAVTYLMSLLSSSPHLHMKLVSESVHKDSLDFLVSSLSENIMDCTWYIRIMGNLVSEQTGNIALELLGHEVKEPTVKNVSTLLKAVEFLVHSGQIFLYKECSWLLGNLLNHNNENVVKYITKTDIIQKVGGPIRYFLMARGI